MNESDKKFLSSFEDEPKEFLVLTEAGPWAAKTAEYSMWTVCLSTLAVIDVETNTLNSVYTRLA